MIIVPEAHLYCRQTVSVDLSVEIECIDVCHAGDIIQYRLYSFVEYGRFYILLAGYPVDEQL